MIVRSEGFRGANRSRSIRSGSATGSGPIVYWMNRDMRFDDNWAMLYALDWARAEGRALIVAYNLVPSYFGGRPRHTWFKLTALEELWQEAQARHIPFAVYAGDDATKSMVRAFQDWDVAGWVTDFCPLRIAQTWKTKIDGVLRVPAVEVDAHNIVPCWIASPKLEVGARTLRPKLAKLLPTFLTDIPSFAMGEMPSFPVPAPHFSRWKKEFEAENEGIDWITPGPRAAKRALQSFVEHGLAAYDEGRNDPTKDTQSNLSPWLHYGNLSAQRVAYEVRHSDGTKTNKDAFLEELIVRRELSDNFCFYQPNYDKLEGAPAWAQASLNKHRKDAREYAYSHHTFERAKTHDELWNAAQTQLVQTGKMHGYMRMYWAKKLLEWTTSPEEALEIGIRLNDAYELDGRDPNGYVGILWSVAGLHDRPWIERPIFGMIRYMNRAGCERKFDVDAYIRRWSDAIAG